MKHRFFRIFLTIILTFSCVIPVMASEIDTREQDNIHVALHDETTVSSVGQYLWKIAFKAGSGLW